MRRVAWVVAGALALLVWLASPVSGQDTTSLLSTFLIQLRNGTFSFTNGTSTTLTAPSDGVLLFTNNAGTAFTQIDLGGTTASFPAIKRNGNTIHIRKADDAGFADIEFASTRLNNNAWLKTTATGVVTVSNSAETTGSTLKVDALPVASACGAGSPAAVAGSTPLAGSVTVGTGGPTTCTITWGGTAYPSAPYCTGSVASTTAANTRAMGYLGATTTLTIVPSAAWADSSVVTWVCISSK